MAIFKGIEADLPGLSLSKVYERQTLQVDKLPTYSREQVEANIQADDLPGARSIVAELQHTAAECAAKPTTTPKPSTPVPSTPVPSSKPPASTPVSKPPASSPPASTAPTGTASPSTPVDPDDCDGVR